MAATVALVAIGAYANTLANGFAMDDGLLILENPAVRQMDLPALLGGPWWPQKAGGHGLYRPLNSLGLSVQWQAWGRTPWAFHAVNVAGHALVSALVFVLLLSLAPPGGALAGGLLFAVHPVHTEAVAGVVGQAEVMAGGLVVLACLAYVRLADDSGLARTGRALLVGLLYFLALCSKEIAVTLPGLLLILGWLRARVAARESSEGFISLAVRQVWRDLPLFLLLTAVLGFFLVLRLDALGTITGVEASPSIRGLGTGERLLTAVSLWPQYARLLLFPFDLVSDYAPAVLLPARTVTLDVLAGAVLAASAIGLAVLARRRVPHIGGGLLWIVLAILPVSHLLFPVAVLLAERTFYLPSVGLSMAAAGLAVPLATAVPRDRRIVLVAGTILLLAFAVRVVTRNPVWKSDASVFQTLAEDHPESFRVQWLHAAALAHRGKGDQADRAYDLAVSLNPDHRSLLVEAATFYGHRGEWAKAEPLLRRAIRLAPWSPEPYAHLARQLILQKRYGQARVVALDGLARAGPSRLLWSFVSETYIAEGRLEAAARARRAALSADPGSAQDWMRLLQILEFEHRPGAGA